MRGHPRETVLGKVRETGEAEKRADGRKYDDSGLGCQHVTSGKGRGRKPARRTVVGPAGAPRDVNETGWRCG